MSNNIINKWSYSKPTEPGDYLVCYGDVETPANVFYVRLSNVYGILSGEDGFQLDHILSYKFARLVYSPTEIKEVEDA
jgi:hypothetical protein